MTFLELYTTELSRALADTGTDFYTTTDRKSWVNQAYAEETELLQPTRKYQRIDTPADVATVALPTDFGSFADGVEPSWTAVTGTYPIRLIRKSVRELDEEFPTWQDGETTGDPVCYLYEPGLPSGEAITLIPTPATAGKLSVYYQQTYPALTEDTDTPWGGLHANHHRLIALAAAVKALELDADPERLAVATGRRDEARGRLALHLAKRAPQATLRLPIAYSTARWRRR